MGHGAWAKRVEPVRSFGSRPWWGWTCPNASVVAVAAVAAVVHPAHAHDHAHDHKHDHAAHDHAAHAGTDAVVCCSHHEIQIDKWILWTLLGGVLVLIGTVGTFFKGIIQKEIIDLPAMLGTILLSVPLFIAAFGELKTLRFSSSTLAAIAIAAATAAASTSRPWRAGRSSPSAWR